MMIGTKNSHALMLVTSVSQFDVLRERLAASPCLQRGGLPWVAYFNCDSAAAAFNAAMDSSRSAEWLIWAHQDVFLPEGWDTRFMVALREAQDQFSRLAVAGVYGIAGTSDNPVRAGHVLDRGRLLKESTSLPCLVSSLDELLLAVRVSSNLRMDPAMGFDFYATDLVLQARTAGLDSAVVDAFCEHWSDTPSSGRIPHSLVERVKLNARAFESKWKHCLPITTPCFKIAAPGDVASFIDSIVVEAP